MANNFLQHSLHYQLNKHIYKIAQEIKSTKDQKEIIMKMKMMMYGKILISISAHVMIKPLYHQFVIVMFLSGLVQAL